MPFENSGYRRRLAVADGQQARMFAFIAACLLLVLATTLPFNPAWAGWIEDGISGIFIPIVVAVLQLVDGLYDGLSNATTILGQLKDSNTQWNELLGSVYGFMSAVQNGVISPIAKQILTLAFMFRLLTIAKIAESNDMSPIVPKVAISCVGFFFMIFIVDNAMAIITVGYDMMQHILQGISDSSTKDITFAVTEEFLSDPENGISLGALFIVGFFCGLIALLTTGIAYIVAIFMYYGKVLTLYFQALFSPIPIALLGVDATRQWGLGYIKNVATTLLSMVIMFINLKIYPLLYTVIVAGIDNGTDQPFDGGLGQLLFSTFATIGPGTFVTIIAPFLALNLLLIFMLVKSSALAKEILGS